LRPAGAWSPISRSAGRQLPPWQGKGIRCRTRRNPTKDVDESSRSCYDISVVDGGFPMDEGYQYSVSIPILIESFPFDMDGALIYYETGDYAIGGEVTFGKDYAYLAGGWVFSNDKDFLDSLEYLTVEWDEKIRDSII
jgi:hypothetical protein